MSRHLPRRGAETHFPLVMWTDGRGPKNNAVSVRIIVEHLSSFAHSARPVSLR